jgi:adenine deaminase
MPNGMPAMKSKLIAGMIFTAIGGDTKIIAAIQMATLNVAEHFDLDHVIGGIAPGKIADMLIIPNPETIRAEYVISNGRVISHNGRLQVPARHHDYSAKSLDTIRRSKKLSAHDFKIRADNTPDAAVKVRVIDMITDLVTGETIEEVPVFDNEITCSKDSGFAKISAIDRPREDGKMFTGLIRNFGLESGALACSAAWDTSCIIVIGADDADMTMAVNRIHELKGGVVICEHNEIICEPALPVFGIISELLADKMVWHMEKIKTAAKRLGVHFPDPLLTLITMTGSAVPYLRICEEGLVNLKDGKPLGLVVKN